MVGVLVQLSKFTEVPLRGELSEVQRIHDVLRLAVMPFGRRSE